jgi:hypothetical protein
MGSAVPNKCVLIYDIENRKEPDVLRYIRPQTGLSWNQTDPSMLATISSDKLLLWDIRQTKKEVSKFPDPTLPIESKLSIRQ